MRRGDPADWERFFHLWGRTLLQYFQQRGFGLQDAEEATQNVLARVHRGIGRFERDGARKRLRHWVYAIARKESIRHRERYLSKPHSLGGSGFQKVSEEQEFPDAAVDSTEQQSFDSLLMRNILQEIEPDFEAHVWRAFWLFVVEERSGPEVATELGMQPNGVRQAVYRVKKRIQKERDNFPKEDENDSEVP